METVTEIVFLAKYSPKRGRTLGDIKDLIRFEAQHRENPQEDIATVIGKLYATRWTMRGNSYLKILSKYDAFMKLLDTKDTSTGCLNFEVKSRIIGVQNKIEQFLWVKSKSKTVFYKRLITYVSIIPRLLRF